MRHVKIITRSLFIGCLLLGLAGCLSLPAGNYAGTTVPAAQQQQMANDAVKQLALLYPPASTHFRLQQRTTDAFGSALIAALRAKGYGVQEATAPSAALRLQYVVDTIDAGFYRVSLKVGSHSLSQIYQLDNDQWLALGNWAYQE